MSGHCKLGPDLCNCGGDLPRVREGCSEWVNEAPAWVATKAAFDALDDGHGPHLTWAFDDQDGAERKRAAWAEFKAWAADNLGQGYSAACNDGHLLDEATTLAFAGFLAGKGLER